VHLRRPTTSSIPHADSTSRRTTINTVSKALAGVVVATAAVAAAVILYLGVSPSTPMFTDADGTELPGSIAVLEKVELGGLDQWILIRGADRSNPVLLWLHGGPGGTQMPFAHHLDRELEDHFVVVHWDQRGAGKSNHGGFDEQTMRLSRYLEDARELIQYLHGRLGQDRIVLLGHSWGTQLGIELVRAHPEYFHAYIGVGQVVNHARATELAHAWLEETIDPEAAPEDWRTLQSIEVPAMRHSEYRKLNQLTDAYGGSLDLTITEMARILMRAPEYTVRDYRRLLQGMNRGGGPMHEGGWMAGFDFIETFPELEVPTYFFMGRNDHNTPLALVEEYCESLRAPHKEVVVFENSAHLPFLAEVERFTEEVIRVAGDHVP
jgi:pimeloyl-ACP methyl ester carboxylesterase